MADLIELRDAVNEAIELRREAADAVDAAENDEALDEAERALDAADEEVKRREGNLARAERVERAKAAKPLEVKEPAKEPATAKGTLRMERVYRPDVSSDQPGFFRDLTLARSGDPQAYERLARNNAEAESLSADVQKRAGLTQTATAGGEFIPPVWYIDQYAVKLRAGRPFLNALGTQPLPPNTNSLNFPKITTGASTAVQSDTGSVSNTDLVTTSVTGQVQTEAGRTVASYQTVDLGPITDQVIMEDLHLSYDTQLDSDLINGSVTNAKGLINVSSINTVTFTNSTPTAALCFPPIFQAVSQIAKNAFVGAELVVMHPSAWYFILAGQDSNNRPLAQVAAAPAFNIAGQQPDMAVGNGVVGNIAGLDVCVDANIPTTQGAGTNQSEMVILNRRGFQVWESAPRFKVADQTSITTLQYQFVMYGYYATVSRQPKMISSITGTGLVVQSGY